MIKAVLFDYGGVLSEGGATGCIQRIFGAIYGIDPSELNKDGDIIKSTQLGEMSGQQFLSEMNRRHPEGQRATRENYLAESDIFVKSEPVHDLADRLRQHGIATGILSNINDFAAETLQDRGFYDGFDPLVLSFQEKIAKPDPRLYRLAVERLGIGAEDVLFVDDSERYSLPAEAMGMRFILAKSPRQIVHDTEALILKENGITL